MVGARRLCLVEQGAAARGGGVSHAAGLQPPAEYLKGASYGHLRKALSLELSTLYIIVLYHTY